MSEDQKAFIDLVNYGCAYMQDGKHVPVGSVKLMPVDNDTAIMRLHVKMFITFIQTKGLWPCFMQIGEAPEPIKTDELFKLVDEFQKLAT